MARCDKLRGHEFFSHDLYFDEKLLKKKKKKKIAVIHHVEASKIE